MIELKANKNGIKVAGDKTMFISSKMGFELSNTGAGMALHTANGKRFVIKEGDTINGKKYKGAKQAIDAIESATSSFF